MMRTNKSLLFCLALVSTVNLCVGAPIDDPEARVAKLRNPSTDQGSGQPPLLKKLMSNAYEQFTYDKHGRATGFKDKGRAAIDTLWRTGASRDDLLGVFGATGTGDEDLGGQKNDPINRVNSRYNSLTPSAKNALPSFDAAGAHDLVYQQVRQTYYDQNPWYSRLATLPSWQTAVAGVGLGTAAVLGNHFLNKINRKLNWVSLERHVRRQQLLEEFGYADTKQLQSLLTNPQENGLSAHLQQVIQRYLEVNKLYKKLNWQWTAAMIALVGGGVGSVVNLGMHINKNPSSQWYDDVMSQQVKAS